MQFPALYLNMVSKT